MDIFDIVMIIVGVYLLCGLIFAIPFVIKGAGSIDPVAKEGSAGFRILIIPGILVFWPLLAKQWISGSQPPEQCNAHRTCAGAKEDS